MSAFMRLMNKAVCLPTDVRTRDRVSGGARDYCGVVMLIVGQLVMPRFEP